MSSEVAKVFVVFYLLAFHTEDFIIDFSVSLMFFLLLLWLLIFPSSMHHKDIHSILAHVHNILLHTAGRDQPWDQWWLLLQALLISFFFPNIHIHIHSVCRDIHIHSILYTDSRDQPLDQLLLL